VRTREGKVFQVSQSAGAARHKMIDRKTGDLPQLRQPAILARIAGAVYDWAARGFCGKKRRGGVAVSRGGRLNLRVGRGKFEDRFGNLPQRTAWLYVRGHVT
jgi:hypothetical protein